MGLVTLLTLVFLAAMWIAVLAAPVLQGRGRSQGGDSIKNFQKQLAVLERGNPLGRAGSGNRGTAARRPQAQAVRNQVRQPVRPHGRPPVRAGRVAAERRRRVVIVLAASVVTTAVAGFTLGGWFWMANLVADALLVAYIAVAVRVVRSAAEAEMKVAFLPHRESGAEPTALLRDAARGYR